MADLINWLRLWHVPGVGPRTFNYLLEKFETPSYIFSLSYQELVLKGISARLAKAVKNSSSTQHHTDIAWMQSNPTHHIITLHNQNYPHLLREITDPPPILYLEGELGLLSKLPNIAIVGGRKATSLGKTQAFKFAQDLAKSGIVVTSGLARGIDSEAHKGALSEKLGKTIAVLAHGLDMVYPREHTLLSRTISAKGLLVSEFPLGMKPLPQNFPRRNRIISGLSHGTIVIEAAEKSGTLITAHYALDQGREVFAVPGPIQNPLNSGCHKLIQDGAKLTTCVEDVLIELQDAVIIKDKEQSYIEEHQSLPSNLNDLLEILEYTPIPIETLIEKSGLTPEQVSSMLTQLEIGGKVTCDAYGHYSRLETDVK